MEYNSLAILLTENCNAKCKMCCDSRGVVQGKTLSIEELDKILCSVNKSENIMEIGITGGEPMLYPELCQYIMDFPFDREIAFTLKTNGFWGNNKEKAATFIEKNSKKLKEISFSYDGFHKEFIDINNIKVLIELSLEYKVPTNVVGCFLKDGIKPGDILNEFGQHAYLTEFYYQPVVRTGSACQFKDTEIISLLNTDKHDIKCTAIARRDFSLLVNPDLDIYPCCSQFIENTILKIGNLNEISLKEAVNSIKYNKIFYTFFTKGFKPFIEFMKKNNINYPKDIGSHCELCGYLFSNEWFLNELAEKNFYEYIEI